MAKERELPRGRFEPHAKEPRRLPEESEFELDEEDEEFQDLVGDSTLEEEPIPEDTQEADIERDAGVYQGEEGAPRRDRLATMADERGRRWVEGATETDPVERLEHEEDDRYRAADRQLDIRRSSKWSGTRDSEGTER